MSSPKRLIEVDLPIKEISKQARREKSIRHGHISTLHIWWARRPLAACRAVVLATLLPDPADDTCPPDFRARAAEALRFRYGGRNLNDPLELRKALLDFIAEFADWDRSTDPGYLGCSRDLVAAVDPNRLPLIVDPFAGGGAIPLEALRIGAEAWASDYNPVAALLLKVVVEEIPRYGARLADAVRAWGTTLKEEVEAEIGGFYPATTDGAVPVAFLWARTVTCEGPECGAEVPLLGQPVLSRSGGQTVALEAKASNHHIDVDVVFNADSLPPPTTRRGSTICPRCGFVTPAARVRIQARAKGGLPARLVAVVARRPGSRGLLYRGVSEQDVLKAVEAELELRRLEAVHGQPLTLVPHEPVPVMSGVFNAPIYGLTDWSRYFTPRQALALSSFSQAVRRSYDAIAEHEDPAFARAVATCLALAVDRCADYWSTLCVMSGSFIAHTFGRQALPMVWDFAEANPFSGATGDWDGAIEWIERVCRNIGAAEMEPGNSTMADARTLPLPDASVDYVITDPPYYNAVPYADLSDFFYVWLRRSIGALYPELFATELTPKAGEIAEMAYWDRERYPHKDKEFFESEMRHALLEAGRILSPDGLAVVVFAHKTTAGWEAMIQAVIDAGLEVTGSWPIDTERPGRLREQNSAALASSIHIVCRPRSDRAGVGSWRDIRPEIERRVGEWLPRLAEEGIEGADAIFACLGPALESYSRYERVETAGGDPVPLSPPPDDRDAPALLPAVWAAVARTALSMLFEGAEAEGFEEDARLTALWLWTVKAALNGQAAAAPETTELAAGEERDSTLAKGFSLDYDTARKLAQALGADLEVLDRPGGIVEVKGSSARLRAVGERRAALMAADPAPHSRDSSLFESGEAAEMGPAIPGVTTLDRLHQAMLLFGYGRSDALRRLLAEPGYSTDERFMRLARSLSALYPAPSPEKRWLDGVLATRGR